MANWAYALSKGVEAGATAGVGLIDAGIKKDDAIEAETRASNRQIESETRAADRRLSDAERLAAINESFAMRAEERREATRISGRAADFEFDTNPENVDAKANAIASSTRITKGAENDVAREEEIRRGNDPEYLDAVRKKTLAAKPPKEAKDATPTALMQNAAYLKGLGYSDAEIKNFIFDKKQLSLDDLAAKILSGDKSGEMTPEQAAAKAVQLRASLAAATDPSKSPAAPKPLAALPAGAKQVGTSNGKPVYRLPNGTQYIQQ